MIIPITTLWLPILVAAIIVFVVSSIIHMFLPYHRNDFRKVPDEDAVMGALRAIGLPPGDYSMPFAGGMEAMRSDAFREKVEKGPVAFFTVLRPGMMFNMGPQLVQWFLYSILVSIVAAYLAGRLLPAGEEYLQVFRVTGTVAFACYSMALMQRSIWYSQSWRTTLTSMFDGLVYAAMTAGVFGWLWPA
jgi:hypothetical protein